MEILLTITYTAFFIFIIHKMEFFDLNGVSKKAISGILILKILSGLALWAIYTFYYTDRATADIYKYFDDSKILFDIAQINLAHFLKILFGIGNNSPEFHSYYAQMHYWTRRIDSSIYNDSHTIIRFNALLRFFSFGYYNVHTVFVCFLSLTGLTGIYKTFVPYLQDKKTELLVAVFFLPSVLFWGSGVLKEGLIFFALGLLIYHFHKLFSVNSIFVCLGSGLLLAFSKFYVWLAILPGLFFILLINKTNKRGIAWKFVIILIVIAITGLNINRFTSIQDPLVTLSQKQFEFNELAYGNAKDAYNNRIPIAKSAIRIKALEPTLSSLIRNSPQALTNVIFRPFVWELKSPMMLLAGLENIFIFAFILICILFMKPLSEIPWEAVLFCLSFVTIQFLIIGCTIPILGALVRYRVPALPFLMIGFLLLLDKEKYLNIFLKNGKKIS